MEKRIETGWLLDFYGPLLTGRQREMLRLYCEEDLSLAEIAGQEGVSRQAVHDAVRRGDAQLRAYEDQLGLLRRYRRLYDALRQCQAAESMQALRDTLARLAEEEGFDGL
ncbi:MAG: hypothetical protein FWD25_13450 [Clostridia bacterium]|nr:hypothetical protein [Clostridia bacterium]